MVEILYIIAKTISVILSVVSAAMLVRMILPWFVDPMESRAYAIASSITEPFIAPVRAVMVMLNIGQDSPIDWAFSIAYILIWLLQKLLADNLIQAKGSLNMTWFKKKTPKEYIIYSAIIIVGIFLDQLTKYLVFKFMDMYQSIPLIKGFLHLTYTTNDGAAFGMMDDPSQRWIFIIISTVAILAFTVYLYLGHAENMLYGVSIAMVVSGGFGNMIDRLGFGFYVNPTTGMGEVIDFIDFCGIWNAIFNGADSFVCVGAGLLILALIKDLIMEYKEEAAKKAMVNGAHEESNAQDGEAEE